MPLRRTRSIVPSAAHSIGITTARRGSPASTKQWAATSAGTARQHGTFRCTAARSRARTRRAKALMDFVLGLHSHLPYVLNHGRWPHGSDWISEAAVDTYLPLIDSLQALAEEQIAAPVTLGITPILANQLASPVFEAELRQFL